MDARARNPKVQRVSARARARGDESPAKSHSHNTMKENSQFLMVFCLGDFQPFQTTRPEWWAVALLKLGQYV